MGTIAQSWGLALIAALALAPTSAGQQIAVEANVEPSLVGVGQTVTLSIEARVDGGIGLDLSPTFELENLEIVAGPFQSQQVSFVNGRVSRSQTLRWSLQATAVGTARVRQLALTVNDQLFELPEQIVEIQEDPVSQASPSTGRSPSTDPFEEFFGPTWRRRGQQQTAEPKLFLRAEVSPRDPYVGEQVLYSLVLLTQADVGSVSPQEMPDFEGMWSVDIEQPRRPQSVMTEVQGERYGKVVLLQRALFPLRDGSYRLAPVEARLIARLPERSWMGPLGTYDREYNLKSNAVTLEVRPLPESPPEFTGAVGNLDLSIELEPRDLVVGDAATLEVTISGAGHVNSLTAPAIPELDDVRVFPPQTSGGDRAVGTTVRGEKSWSYVLVPERSGVWEIPIDSYHFFNPTTDSFEQTPKQILVMVARPSEVAESRELAEDLPGPAAEQGMAPETADVAPNDSPPRWLPIVASLLALGLSVAFGRRLLARWRATAHLRRHLREAVGMKKPRAAAETIERAWRDFLAERWEVPISTAAGAWSTALSQQGVPADTAAEVARLADDLHYLRYAPELSTYRNVLDELVERSRLLARSLG